MYEQPIKSVMEQRKLLTATPQTSVHEAAQRMAASDVDAVLVVEEDRLLGIFTEHDAVYRVMAAGLDPRQTALGTVMTAAPVTIDPEQPYGVALVVMQERGIHHLPVVVDGRPVGIVATRNAFDPEMEEFVAEANRRDHFARMQS